MNVLVNDGPIMLLFLLNEGLDDALCDVVRPRADVCRETELEGSQLFGPFLGLFLQHGGKLYSQYGTGFPMGSTRLTVSPTHITLLTIEFRTNRLLSSICVSLGSPHEPRPSHYIILE